MAYCNLNTYEVAAATSVFKTEENIQQRFNSHFNCKSNLTVNLI